MLEWFKSFKELLEPEKPPTADVLYQIAVHGATEVLPDLQQRINRCIERAVDWAHKKALYGECQCLTKIDADLLDYKKEIIEILQNKYKFIVVDCETFNKKYSHLLLLDVEGVSKTK